MCTNIPVENAPYEFGIPFEQAFKSTLLGTLGKMPTLEETRRTQASASPARAAVVLLFIKNQRQTRKF
jgi:hypothetical protein